MNEKGCALVTVALLTMLGNRPTRDEASGLGRRLGGRNLGVDSCFEGLDL